jgi:predicted molibdopterin-dependent oxidoreductase YjgC
MDDIFIPLWPPAWVEDHALSDEQVVAAGEDVRLMSALRSDQRVLLSVSWPGGRRYLMIDPHGDGAAEAFRAGATSTDPDLARSIDAMWSQALRLAKQIEDGEAPIPEDQPRKRRPWRRRD